MLKGYRPGQIVEMAKTLFREERALKRLDGWFYAREAAMSVSEDAPLERKAANELRRMIMTLPLDLSANAVFAGTQRDAFARTYALIKRGVYDPGSLVTHTAYYKDAEAMKTIFERSIDKQDNYMKGVILF